MEDEMWGWVTDLMKLTLELSTYVNVTGFIYFLHLQKINSGSQCKLQVKGKYYFENYHFKKSSISI